MASCKTERKMFCYVSYGGGYGFVGGVRGGGGFTNLSIVSLYSADWNGDYELVIGAYLAGNSSGLIEVLSRHMPRRTEENQVKSHSRIAGAPGLGQNRTRAWSSVAAPTQNGEYDVWRGRVKYGHLSPTAGSTILNNSAIGKTKFQWEIGTFSVRSVPGLYNKDHLMDRVHSDLDAVTARIYSCSNYGATNVAPTYKDRPLLRRRGGPISKHVRV
jgi:hypothetical protein